MRQVGTAGAAKPRARLPQHQAAQMVEFSGRRAHPPRRGSRHPPADEVHLARAHPQVRLVGSLGGPMMDVGNAKKAWRVGSAGGEGASEAVHSGTLLVRRYSQCPASVGAKRSTMRLPPSNKQARRRCASEANGTRHAIRRWSKGRDARRQPWRSVQTPVTGRPRRRVSQLEAGCGAACANSAPASAKSSGTARSAPPGARRGEWNSHYQCSATGRMIVR